MWVVVNNETGTSLVEVAKPPVAADKLVWDTTSKQFSDGKTWWLDMESKQWLSAKGVHMNLMEGYTQEQRMAEVANWKQSVQFTGWEGKFVTVNGQQIPAKDFILQAVEKYAGAIQSHHDLPEIAKDAHPLMTKDPLAFLLQVKRINFSSTVAGMTIFTLRGAGAISLNLDNLTKGWPDTSKAPLTVITIIKEGAGIARNLTLDKDPCSTHEANTQWERDTSVMNIVLSTDIGNSDSSVKGITDRWRDFFVNDVYPGNNFAFCK